MSLKQISQYYLIMQEHEDWLTWERLNLRSEIIDYIEQFYIRKVKQGSLTLEEVWQKLLGLDPRFPMSLRRHMYRHIRLEVEEGPSPPPPPPPPRNERWEALLQLLENKRRKKVEFDGHAWVRDKRGRIHLIDLVTHKYAKIHKSERNKIRKYYLKELGKLARQEAERQIAFAMSNMFKVKRGMPPHEKRIRRAMASTFKEPKVKRVIRQEAEKDIEAAMNNMFKPPAEVPLKITPPLRTRIAQAVRKAIARIFRRKRAISSIYTGIEWTLPHYAYLFGGKRR